MPRIEGSDRYQVRMTALDDVVGDKSVARLIDAFVSNLDLAGQAVRKVSIS